MLLFQWRLIQEYLTRRNRCFPDEQSFLTICCALGVTFCTILSTTLFDVIYLNLAVLPACIGALYGHRRSGLSLAGFFLLCTVLFSRPPGLDHFLIDSGLLAFPLVFALAPSFKRSPLPHKIGIFLIVLFPTILAVLLEPYLWSGHSIYDTTPDELLLIMAYLCLTTVLGGVFIYFIETAWDQLQSKTQMKDISEQFRWESHKLRQITDAAGLNIMALDNRGYVTELNEYMLDLIRLHNPDLTREMILSRSVCEIFNKTIDDQTFDRLKTIVRNNQRSNAKLQYDSRTYQVYTAPLRHNSGALAGNVLIVQDLTEEEKMRTELDNVERLTLVGQMAAGITHEIRNPMAVVRGFLQLMREKSPSDLDSYYQIVMDELDRANGIINDFLSLAQSRISDMEPVQLHSVIEDLGPLLWADANLRGQTVELKLSGELPRLHLNVREIKQLVLNLARNAMEAMEAKGVLTLETRLTGEQVELVIRDTGSGIPQSQLENLFVPFFTTKSHGTGLGLSLCLSIVERHGGKIAVASEEGYGTEFTVSFPCQTADLPLEING
ncbi:two-component system sensor histidine kinase NtrB [Paenibacillus tengchongensis]|uniref:two-component system sensor histidine kinase NtrB n=1 Tax=Paenibacillus tengchongensis TaxID=2608684 RepID=UPI001FE3E957|nr:ATP-binding protein [Paenibacillus tengchongensis]